MDSEGQVTPFDQNKEEKYLAGSPQGREATLPTIIYYHPSPIPMKETKSLTPSHVTGFMRDMPPSPFKWTTDSAHLLWGRQLEPHQGLEWNPHNWENTDEPVSKGPCGVFKSTLNI